MGSAFCISACRELPANAKRRKFFNTKQGPRFSGEAFIIAIREFPFFRNSIDGRSRALDSVFVDRLRRRLKHVNLYLDGNSSGTGLHQGLREYFQFYDAERLLQSFSSQIPDGAYASEVGGGAAIVEEFVEFGQRHSAF